MGWFFRDYLFNIKISAEVEDASSNSPLVRDLAGKTVSVREDGVIFHRPRRKLQTYNASLDLDVPAHFEFGEEQPSIEMPTSFLLDIYSSLLMMPPSPSMPLKTTTIEIVRPGKYRLDLQRDRAARTSRGDILP